MNIEITQDYKASLVPFPTELLEPLNLPKETFEFLKDVGLPVHSNYEITPNAPITFFEQPYVKKHPHLQNTFLYIASMDVMGLIGVDVKNQGVFHMVPGESYRGEEPDEIPYLMNYGIRQLVDCLGLWLSFYPQLREEIDRQLELDPTFSLFDHEELYKPIVSKLKEADSKTVRYRKSFWRRMCEPDIV